MQLLSKGVFKKRRTTFIYCGKTSYSLKWVDKDKYDKNVISKEIIFLQVYRKRDYIKIFDLNEIKPILYKTIANASTIDDN